MTAREKLLSAFGADGTPEIGVVASYDGIFIRDHWFSFTEVPWWEAHRGIVDKDIAWTRDFSEKSGLEWLAVWQCPSRAERSSQRCERREDGVWLIDGAGKETRLSKPTPSGANTACATSEHTDLDSLPATRDEIDALIPAVPEFDRNTFLAEGRHDGAAAIRESLDLLLYSPVASPLWSLYGRFGYEGMMIFPAQDPQLALYMGRRILESVIQSIRMFSALDVDAIWIEECLTDQLGPQLFRDINVPILQECVAEIRACGMKSIYYYCGNPHDRFDAILDVGADAVHFEESKKGFTIDIADIVDKVNGRCTVFGNLDAIDLLQNGAKDELRSEIMRQLEAGKRNGGRFIMSTGSPITPGTSVEKVRLYADLVRELES